MFDVFYIGPKPNLFAHEQEVSTIEQAQELSRTRYCWIVDYLTDYTGFDFLWEPVPWQSKYTHVWPGQWPEYYGAYLVPKNSLELNYHIQSKILFPRRFKENYQTLAPCEFDYSWVPHPWDPPYIYVFGNQWHSAEKMPTVEYHMPGATERKYMSWPLAKLPADRTHWTVPDNIDPSTVDYSWVPDPGSPPYIYHFPSQHQSVSGVTYTVPGASEINITSDLNIRSLPNKDNWYIPEYIDAASIDYSWHPNPLDPPCNYMFDTKWHWDRVGGSEYRIPGATDIKYVYDFAINTKSDPALWHIPDWIDPASIDYSWVPNPTEPAYIYEFPVEWGWNNIGGPEYRVPGARDKKYATEFQARTLPDPTHFTLSDNLDPGDLVFRWRPNPTEPPYIYVFGNQWHTAETRESARYTVPGATQVKYVDDIRCTRLPDATKFNKLYNCEFDCSWEPDPGSPPYNYIFGNQYYSAEVMPTVEYKMAGATEVKYMDIPAELSPDPTGPWVKLHDCEWDYTWRPEPGSPAYTYVFGNQWWPAEKMPTVEYHMPGATERKYMPGPVATLPIDMTHWHIPEGVDTRDMDFSWVPDPGEPAYIYQFATQHQKTGGPQYRVAGATEVKYLDMMRAEVSREAVPIFEIDHLDGNAGQIPDTVRRVRYFDNYRDTLIRLAKSLKGEYEHVWVCSSVCDYTDFDFSWHPETWQSTMLHVFASNNEKFGDTFYMHVPTFADRAEKKELLEWYSVNYVPRKSVPRRPMPVIKHTDDTQVDAIKTQSWAGPLAVFQTTSVMNRNSQHLPTVPLWREKTKTVVPCSPGASVVIVAKVAVPYIRTQVYDYPNIDKTQKSHYGDEPLDIVFISNGEVNADYNYEKLRFYHGNWNKIKRVDRVPGRVAAYHAAARASSTPWFFAVFAKLEVNPEFDWLWQPDRLQQPKHYIFHARNPVNGLEYGHQAMIAYNKSLTLANTGTGLDFTLDSAHEVVPILSGTAYYNSDDWTCWRTAFRECVKLRAATDVESQYRLKQWLTVNNSGTTGEWSIRGAQDAVEYYESVDGDFAELRKSYDWTWLASYAFVKHSLSPDQ